MARFDQRLVRRDGNVWRRQGGVPLCEVCGSQEVCSLRQALSVMGQSKRAMIMVPSCGDYLPVVGFQDRSGVHDSFNTFRRGRGWARRVQPGHRVGLYDMTADVQFSRARVVAVHVGQLGALLAAHAGCNHLMRSLPGIEAVVELERVLKRLYGKTYAALDQEFTVLDLEEIL